MALGWGFKPMLRYPWGGDGRNSEVELGWRVEVGSLNRAGWCCGFWSVATKLMAIDLREVDTQKDMLRIE
jgi:hypothetical protein